MRRIVVTASAAVLLLPLVLGNATQPVTGAANSVYTSRFAPSGTVTFPGRDTPTRLVEEANVPIPSPTGSGGCPDASATNVRVNQECTNQSTPTLLGRGQSQNETTVDVNPRDADNIVAGQNDYREGDAGCGVDWSLDGGEHWGSQILPLDFTAPGIAGGARHYWDANGDPVVAFDADGEAYYACLAFDRGPTADFGDNASGVFVFRSRDGGASWSFPGSPVAQSAGTGEDGIGLIDKEWMGIDQNEDSPYRNRIYVVWNQYNLDFTADPVTFAYSDDHGVSWHQTGSISGFDPDLCPINFDGSPPGTCNANGFPMVFVGPDAAVYVVFMNYNNCSGSVGCEGNPDENQNQVLIVKSTDGGNSFGGPVKVAEFHELPDCVTYTGENFGRSCVPTAPLSVRSVFRAANYPVGAAFTGDRLVVSFGSYINKHSNPNRLGNCSPAGINPDTGLNLYEGVGEVDGCNNDILRSVSYDGGQTWTGGSLPDGVLPSINDEGPVLADQWWHWSDLSPGGRLVTMYYDRKYEDDQSSGEIDVSLAVGGGTPAFTRVTDASMPPFHEFPGISGYGTFLGDYNALAVGPDGVAHPVWPDTRNPIFTFNPNGADARKPRFAGYGADIYTAGIQVKP
ncbi:MAG: exo-alpha-sialidase [Actinobacteria bacterium]|nr:exo-alpha-sialidase [Actinomycetota bacterium]